MSDLLIRSGQGLLLGFGLAVRLAWLVMAEMADVAFDASCARSLLRFGASVNSQSIEMGVEISRTRSHVMCCIDAYCQHATFQEAGAIKARFKMLFITLLVGLCGRAMWSSYVVGMCGIPSVDNKCKLHVGSF